MGWHPESLVAFFQGKRADGPRTSNKRCVDCDEVPAKVWGPSLWNFLHLLALSYPDSPTSSDKARIREFLVALQKILPCTKCREHFATAISNSLDDAAVSSKDAFFDWTVKFHNRASGGKNVKNAAHWRAHYRDQIAKAKA